MALLLKRALSLLIGNTAQPKKRPFKNMTERELIELESELGRDIFGPIEKGGRREFFCLDKHTWIWYEEWVDNAKTKRSRTTRYELHDNGIMKAQDGTNYQFLDGQELKNFGVAVRMYYERVMRGLYKLDPETGAPLTVAPDTIDR